MGEGKEGGGVEWEKGGNNNRRRKAGEEANRGERNIDNREKKNRKNKGKGKKEQPYPPQRPRGKGRSRPQLGVQYHPLMRGEAVSSRADWPPRKEVRRPESGRGGCLSD